MEMLAEGTLSPEEFEKLTASATDNSAAAPALVPTHRHSRKAPKAACSPPRPPGKSKVVDALCQMVTEAGGSLRGAQMGDLYQKMPGSQAEVRRLGLKSVASWSGGRLSFQPDSGAGTIILGTAGCRGGTFSTVEELEEQHYINGKLVKKTIRRNTVHGSDTAASSHRLRPPSVRHKKQPRALCYKVPVPAWVHEGGNVQAEFTPESKSWKAAVVQRVSADGKIVAVIFDGYADVVELPLGQLRAINKPKVAPVRAKITKPKPTHECCMCFEFFPPTNGLSCSTKDHFTCRKCFIGYVQMRCDPAGFDMEKAKASQAELCCPLAPVSGVAGGCSATPFKEVEIARLVDEKAFAMYRARKDQVSHQLVHEEAHATMQRELNRINKECSDAATAQVSKRMLAQQLQQQLPNAKMCGRCHHGPIDHGWCSDLSTHHQERRGEGTISNACPKCQWFVNDIHAWPSWDGELRD